MVVPKVFVVTRLLGIYPFGNHGHFSKSWALYSVSFITFFLLGTIYSSYTFVTGYFKYTTVELLAEFVEISVLCTIPPLHFFILVKNRRKLHFIHQFWQKSSNVNQYNNYLFSIPVPCFVCMLVLLSWEFDDTDIVFSIPYLVYHQTTLFIIIQFATIMKMAENELKPLSSNLNIPRHTELISFCRKVNSIYGLQLIAVIFCILMDATFRAQETILLFSTEMKYAPARSTAKMLFCSHKFVFSLLHLYLLGRACSSTSKTADDFNQKLFQVMRNDEELCKNRKLFTYVTLRPTVEFTALGYFKLGYPLIVSMVSSVTTYLIVMIQFHDLQNQRKRGGDQSGSVAQY